MADSQLVAHRFLGAERSQADLEQVLEYCAGMVRSAAGDTRRERLNFWGTLALMRCAASSPAAAVQALHTRAGLDASDEETFRERLFDGSAEALLEDDVEPPLLTVAKDRGIDSDTEPDDTPALEEGPLADLIQQAEKLAGTKGDPKLKRLADHLAELIDEGFNPVVFCRYIATARYLGRQFETTFKDVTVAVVTGELTAEERKAAVARLSEAEKRLLIATDCLSEGINLQDHFDAVVHYDLSWNPTRHEQREGRVDRFGQPRDVVRATLLYGADNPVDGAVLEVILRKIREDLGVLVPLPDDGHSLTQALMRAVFLRRPRAEVFDFVTITEAEALQTHWQGAAEKAKKNHTLFSQRSLKPDEVLPEWHKSLSAIGRREDVQRFTDRALSRLGTGLEPWGRGFKAPLASLPDDVRERLEAEGLSDTLRIDFRYPAAPGFRAVQRSHPLVSVLAETLLERTLGRAAHDGNGSDVDASETQSTDPGVLGRVGVWISGAVESRTTVVLLRLRHQLMVRRSATASEPERSSTLLVEEATAVAWIGASDPTTVEGSEAVELLAAPPMGDPPERVRQRHITQALKQLDDRQAALDEVAERRAAVLLEDHRRVRQAAKGRGSYEVKAFLPADVIGVFVLLPRVG